MIQGTCSNAGKSVFAMALCRILRRRGYSVAPFKPQNMSNNAQATIDGREVSRAQALQAAACDIEPNHLMNPVILKPEGQRRSQVLLHGKSIGSYSAADYYKLRGELFPEVLASFAQLRSSFDVVVVEGAGSASEVNLRQFDIANMGFAEAADIPVVIIADIDRGGVIASLVGTAVVLTKSERERVKGYVINRFRGDTAIFEPAIDLISQKTNWPCFGIVPWVRDALKLPAEDSQDLDARYLTVGQEAPAHSAQALSVQALSVQARSVQTPGTESCSAESCSAPISILVPCLDAICNFDDLDPLAHEPNVTLRLIYPHQVWPSDVDAVIIPGSKATISDLRQMKRLGWDQKIKDAASNGTFVMGLCGGFQMLGLSIDDPHGVESSGVADREEGIGLLDVDTILESQKYVGQVEATIDSFGLTVTGYEIHMGETTRKSDQDNFSWVSRKPQSSTMPPLSTMPQVSNEPIADGAISARHQVIGTYVHGIFANDELRERLLEKISPSEPLTTPLPHSVPLAAPLTAPAVNRLSYRNQLQDTIDRVADHFESNLEIDRLIAIAFDE